MADATESYGSLVTALKQIALLGSIGSVLGWDERTQLPEKGTAHRADQASLLATMIHERFTAPAIDHLLAEVETSDLMSDRESDAAVNVRETRRAYDRARKLPGSLVEEMSRTEVLAQQVWGEARAKSDYAMFRPWMDKWVDLKRQEAECVGYAANPYDALLDQFEPGETAAGVRKTFESLREPLVELVARIVNSGRQAPIEILRRDYPAPAQEKLAKLAAAAVGFDFSAGRLDISLHPFCTGLGPGDTRMTTRYREKNFSDAIFGVLHETGHGLYDQGLNPAHYGTPRGEAISLGIHESQSRMWENLVGRSRSFWRYFLPIAKSIFPAALTDVSESDWYFAINDVRPSLIRTEADEATYNLHVLLRFELEEAMLKKDLSPADLPGAWTEKMRKYLGLTPPDDARGCLQDIHWSGGAIGYFPTYTLGNLYAAQFFEQARKDVGDLDEQFARGEFAPLLSWLRRNIHTQGKRYQPRELVMKVTGADLGAEPLLRHLRKKAEIYGV
ncbi:MAG TPA: carboxypeptidase M32 [Tepidisphaeraceae bacterium]|jgi:carboxypeptidase Taq|nr:carboxypeptidase M32 [Tepidisphaeraceae bacterium]